MSDESVPARAQHLLGRASECASLDQILADARTGVSRVIVLRGEPGVGKTALLDYVFDAADGFEVVRISGVESEMHFSFAGLHALFFRYLDELHALPRPQRAALESAFGIVVSAPPDRFLVALGVLTLLDKIAQARPVCCVVDDAQWLDSESLDALAFVGRRLAADRICVLFATRDDGRLLEGFPEIKLAGLTDAFAHRLLESVASNRMDQRVANQLVEEAQGNPLAILEFVRELTDEQLAGDARLPEGLPLGQRLEPFFQKQLQGMPADTQTLLLIVAAELSGDTTVIWNAGRALGIADEAVDPAVRRELLASAQSMRFRHPLIRSAAYRNASPSARRRVYQALADVTRELEVSYEHAWYLGSGTAGPDENVAEQLEVSAVAARWRGGYASEAALLERAADCSSDSFRRSRRLLAAGQAALNAGAPNTARRLVERVEIVDTDVDGYVQALRLRAAIAVPLGKYHDAASLLLNAALELETLDLSLARVTMLEAVEVILVTRHLTVGTSPAEIGRAGLRMAGANESASLDDELLRGFSTLLARGHADAVPHMRVLTETLASDAIAGDDILRLILFGLISAQELWDLDALRTWTSRVVESARARGALERLRTSLCAQATIEAIAGDFNAAVARHEEARNIANAIGGPAGPWAAMNVDVLAWQGREAEARAAARVLERGALAIGAGSSEDFPLLALVVLELGLGHFREAFALAQRICDHETIGAANHAVVELVEAAVRCEEFAAADEALARVTPHLAAASTDWALGLLARSRALRAAGDEADALYGEAIGLLSTSDAAVDLARAHLLYGEWLRRAERVSDARQQLHVALDMFRTMGADAFAARTSAELVASGERAQRHVAETRTDLTAQEEHIARLAADGATNLEIAADLFISPNTVEYPLRKVFRKLDVNSRRKLAGALSRP
jgi:DNA-binding CsgD family transcriptional regulator